VLEIGIHGDLAIAELTNRQDFSILQFLLPMVELLVPSHMVRVNHKPVLLLYVLLIVLEHGERSLLVIVKQIPQRTFRVTTPDQNGGTPCIAADGQTESQSCVPVSCAPIACVGAWGPFSNCSCVTNSSERIFTVTTPAANGGTPCEAQDQAVESEPCSCEEIGGGFPFWAIILIVLGALLGLLLLGALLYALWISQASQEDYDAV